MLENLKKLKIVVSRLNESSDTLTEALTQINDKLNTMNIGLTVWLDGGPSLSTRLIEKPKGTAGDVYTVESKEILGYTKTKIGWGLAVKSIRVEHGYFEGDRNSPFANPIEGEIKPLLDSTRDLRIAAIELLPKIIGLLKDAAEETINSIEQAKKLAAEL